MAKKAITQVMEWLQEVRNDSENGETTVISVGRADWAIKLLKRVDARDSQNQKPRKRAKKAR